MKTPTDPNEALATINALDKFGINLGLERISAALGVLGDPQKKYATVHVGGTNGKGSTCAILSKTLELSGYKVGLYTSPPLEHFGERIRINGVPMDKGAVPPILNNVLATAEKDPRAAEMTQFEIITAIAFEHFAREEVDVAVVEVGMGGRLDSTNVVAPVATAVTNVGLDHSEHLGESLGEIALEKAGIAKRGVTMSTCAEGEALAAIKAHCLKTGAPLKVFGQDFSFAASDDWFTYNGADWSVAGLRLALPGLFQRKNLSLAASVLETLVTKGFKLDPKVLVEAAASVRWPGRMESFGTGPVVMVDGAHNPHAAAALVESLVAIAEKRIRAGGRLHLILGVLGDKDATVIVEKLSPLADCITLTRSASVRALAPEELSEATSSYANAQLVADLPTALKSAVDQAGREDLIVCTGSLTIVAEAHAVLAKMGLRG